MRSFFTTILLFTASLVASAQTNNDNVLKFLGHPVDGRKSDMESHLISKGYTYNRTYDCYEGRFNGKQANICISTNNNKIDRIYVEFLPTSESYIRYEYNNLIDQFNRNNKYTSIIKNEKISENENISYGINIQNKQYSATYFLATQIDSASIAIEIKEKASSIFTDEEIELIRASKNPDFNFEDLKPKEQDVLMNYLALCYELLSNKFKGCVWFTIHEKYGEYYIGIYYDNLNNRPNGEDL